MKTYSKIIILLLLIFPFFTFCGCKFFENPFGEAELLSVYSSESEYKIENKTEYIRYLNATLKITNTGKIDIYNSTVSIQADTDKRTYYKTLSFDITIKPSTSIYIPVQFEIDTHTNGSSTEKWKDKTIKITGVSYK